VLAADGPDRSDCGPAGAAIQALVQVAGDAAGDLVQVGGLGEQAGQVGQLPRRELIKGAGNLDLGA
jgi:hypothetical protein